MELGSWCANGRPRDRPRLAAPYPREIEMEFLGQFHPQIVHFPVALIVAGAIFELIGRATRLEWWRKAAFALLVFGVLGAGAAVLSGREAAEVAADRHGVPEQPIEAHEELAQLSLWIGVAAVLARALAGRAGAARRFLSVLALVLQLGVAVLVGVAGHRGGKLVFEYGAAVRVHGQPVMSGPAHEAD